MLVPINAVFEDWGSELYLSVNSNKINQHPQNQQKFQQIQCNPHQPPQPLTFPRVSSHNSLSHSGNI